MMNSRIKCKDKFIYLCASWVTEMVMPLDPKNLSIIDASEIPTIRRKTVWDRVFDSIEAGKAAVIDEEDASPSTIRQALRIRQEKGLYPNFRITQRGRRGSIKTYVVHEIPE